jgi:fructose 5-dehydrogenase cytochrome subunit
VDEPSVIAQHAPPEDLRFRWESLGELSYSANCSNCHRADGTGWDQYPPLRRAGAMAQADGGRDYLIDLMLYGLDSDRWGAPMPRMGHMHDVEIAAVLNYMLEAFGGIRVGEEPILPQDVAARRGQPLSPRQTNTRRPQ